MITKKDAHRLADALETVCSDFAEDHETAMECAVLIRTLVQERDCADEALANAESTVVRLLAERDAAQAKLSQAWEEGRMAGWYNDTNAEENPYLSQQGNAR